MQKLSPGSIPFVTSDAILAFCLYSVGIPFENSARPLRNEYDAEILRKKGFRGEVNLLEASRECLERGRRGEKGNWSGRIRYIFKRTSDLPKFLKIFAAQEKEITAPDSKIDVSQWQREVMAKVSIGELDWDTALLRLNCVTLKLNVQFKNIWKELPGIVRMGNPGRIEKSKGHLAIKTNRGTEMRETDDYAYPGWKEVSTNASEKTLRRLKLI